MLWSIPKYWITLWYTEKCIKLNINEIKAPDTSSKVIKKYSKAENAQR